MPGQILELIIFAAIAFFVINKLISILGKTSEDDPSKNKSFFGESDNTIKDVTSTGTSSATILRPKFLTSNKIDLKNIVLLENKDVVEEGLKDLLLKIPSFNPERFLKSSRVAFNMIIEASLQNQPDQLEELIDKRYIDKFKSISAGYRDISDNMEKLSSQISEIYMFGNNVFIKILFTGKNITNKLKNFHEEWTFSKSTISSDPGWYLTNVDKAS